MTVNGRFPFLITHPLRTFHTFPLFNFRLYRKQPLFSGWNVSLQGMFKERAEIGCQLTHFVMSAQIYVSFAKRICRKWEVSDSLALYVHFSPFYLIVCFIKEIHKIPMQSSEQIYLQFYGIIFLFFNYNL